jgi:hypothetical protein
MYWTDVETRDRPEPIASCRPPTSLLVITGYGGNRDQSEVQLTSGVRPGNEKDCHRSPGDDRRNLLMPDELWNPHNSLQTGGDSQNLKNAWNAR